VPGWLRLACSPAGEAAKSDAADEAQAVSVGNACSRTSPSEKAAGLKILAVSDQVSPCVYSHSIVERFGDVDLAVSCGDLPYSYLEYIHTMLNVPSLYVHGNHDRPECAAGGREIVEPGGWVDLHGKVVRTKGLLLAGLQGSIRYKPGAPYQSSEVEMRLQVLALARRLLLNRFRYGRYLDILVTHSPPLGINDGDDFAHRGFAALLTFMKWFRPRYLLHGHKHIHRSESRRTCYLETDVINVYPYRVIEV
jgi:hypothetical protein